MSTAKDIHEEVMSQGIESHVSSVSQSPWELTTSRAMAAYNTFTDFGVDPGRFVRVAGCGSARSVSDDSQDIRNNRLTLQILFVPEDN
jgi:flagellar motor protein MotB